MSDRILVFIPCYNCAPQIGRVLAQIRGAVANHVAEVLVLDNGSGDGSAEAAMAAAASIEAPFVTIARNRANYNLGGSHKAAYAYATREGFSHVITLHGDDQGDLRDIAPLLNKGQHRRSDACLGARFACGSTLSNYSAVRILGNRLFNIVFSVVSRRWVTDIGSGLNILARKAFTDPAILRLPDDLHFNPYLLLDMIDRGNKVAFFPISWREDDQVSNVRVASQALKTLGAPARYMFTRGRFRRNDHRSVRHADYAFDVIARIEGKIRAEPRREEHAFTFR